MSDGASGRRPGLAHGIGAILLWCLTGVCFAGGSRALGPMVFTTCISTVGLVTGIAVQVASGRRCRDAFRLQPRVWAAGFFGVTVYTVLLVLAVGISSDRDVAQVALVNYMWPVLIVLLTGAMGERTGASRWPAVSGCALGFAGVAVTRGTDLLVRPPSDLIPHAMALVGAALWATYSVLLRVWRVPTEETGATAQWLPCAVVAGLVGLWRGEWHTLGAPSAAAAGWVLLCGLGPVGVAYHWWEIAMKRGPADLVAVLSFGIPVVSAAAMAAVFRETLSPTLLPGAALIALGAAVANRGALAAGRGIRVERHRRRT